MNDNEECEGWVGKGTYIEHHTFFLVSPGAPLSTRFTASRRPRTISGGVLGLDLKKFIMKEGSEQKIGSVYYEKKRSEKPKDFLAMGGSWSQRRCNSWPTFPDAVVMFDSGNGPGMFSSLTVPFSSTYSMVYIQHRYDLDHAPGSAFSSQGRISLNHRYRCFRRMLGAKHPM